jgi:hypothetical protein
MHFGDWNTGTMACQMKNDNNCFGDTVFLSHHFTSPKFDYSEPKQLDQQSTEGQGPAQN